MFKRTIFLLSALLFSVGLYELPYIWTLARTGWGPLPPVLEGDQMLYLNLSAIHYASATHIVNPWYGSLVPVIDVPHLRFPVAFFLFHFAHALFPSWTLAMLVWAGVWAGLTFIAADFCIGSLLPDIKVSFKIVAAFALLVLQAPLTYITVISHVTSLPALLSLRLPYTRFAVPQVAVPAVLTYLGMQARAFNGGSKWLLVGMACLQLAVCAAFPYFLPIVAIGTLITVLIAKCDKGAIPLSWSAISVYAATCGILDISYLVLTGMGKSQGNVQFALHFRPEMLLPSLRPFVFALLLSAGLAMLSRASLAARATAAGLAVANALFGFSDVFFPAQAQILDHPFYIISLTGWLPLLVFVGPILDSFNSSALRVAMISSLGLLGIWEGFASYRSNISMNLRQAAAVSELGKLALSDQDLVVAPAHFADDISSWIPLVSPAKVLYTPDGENILSSGNTRGEHTLRQAVYLSMTGVNVVSLTSATANDSPDWRLTPLLQQGDRAYQRSRLAVDRVYVRSLLRERLGPLLAHLDLDPASARDILSGYGRILVVDSRDRPVFDVASFSRWLEIKNAYESSGIRIWICNFRVGS